jgi:hypothetical protein|tara:strand:- start:103 stop:1353 length:1251 start_codon:yes stop_codon:yes gene_type:complete
MESNKNLFYSRIVFFLLSITLIIGFFFNEDSAGSGGFIADFNNTWGYVEVLKESFFVLPSKWVMHTPLHFIILSKAYMLIENQYLIRLTFCIISILLPFLFYLCLKINYPNENKNNLLTLASLTFLLPSFRAGAIWANDHITALFFFLLFLIFFLKWIKKSNFEKLTGNIYLQLIFLALAVYTRQYYALIYVYCMCVYFKKFSLFNFLKLSLIVSVLAIPGFFLIYFDPVLLKVTFDTKLQNTVLISSSILSFYLIPIFFAILFFNKEKPLIEKRQQFLIILVSVIIVLLFSFYFDYNYKIGGGYFLKLSYLLINNEILFLISSMVGLILLFNLAKEDNDNILLICILIIGFSSYRIFQKYFEPTFFFIFFLMIKSSIQKDFLKNIKNIYFLFFYLGIYLTTAIINDVYKITKTIL